MYIAVNGRKPSSWWSTRKMVSIAMLSAISYLLAFLELPMPLSPSFAKMDFSDFPALLAAFTFGPFAGVAVELLKNALQLFATSTSGVGELANFLIGSALVLPAGLIYRHRKTQGMAWVACIIGSLAMGIAAAIFNYYLLLPMFERFLPMDAVIAAFAEFVPFIQTKTDVVLYSALPTTTLKGLSVSLLAMLLYKRLSPVPRGQVSTGKGRVSHNGFS